MLQHLILHMFDAFVTQTAEFVCICCGICLHLFAFVCICCYICLHCCGISLHLLWHLFLFVLQCSTYMFANVLAQTVNVGTNVSVYAINVIVYVSKCNEKCVYVWIALPRFKRLCDILRKNFQDAKCKGSKPSTASTQ